MTRVGRSDLGSTRGTVFSPTCCVGDASRHDAEDGCDGGVPRAVASTVDLIVDDVLWARDRAASGPETIS